MDAARKPVRSELLAPHSAPYYGTLCEIMASDGNTRLARRIRDRMSFSTAGRADRCQDARPVCAEEGQYPRFTEAAAHDRFSLRRPPVPRSF